MGDSSLGSIDFSAILEEEFRAMEAKENSRTDMDVSVLAGEIVTNALHIPQSLFCPFCADEYMFQFTLKDHLKRQHFEELQKQVKQRDVGSHACPMCGALFFHFGLVPKHIHQRHGRAFLQQWQQENAENLARRNAREPSIVYAACSPGLSEIFDALTTNEKAKPAPEAKIITPSKSILKKTPIKGGKIIVSPSAVSIRRTKSDYVKRCTPVRRELRFDLPPLKKSPQLMEKLPAMPRDDIRSSWRLPWRRRKPSSPKKSTVLTSTPINALGDSDVPSFFALERFQCARCRKTWDNNAELLQHLKGHHWSAKHFMRPHYRCAQCGATFFRNSYLVRHCHFHHTPIKQRVIRN